MDKKILEIAEKYGAEVAAYLINQKGGTEANLTPEERNSKDVADLINKGTEEIVGLMTETEKRTYDRILRERCGIR